MLNITLTRKMRMKFLYLTAIVAIFAQSVLAQNSTKHDSIVHTLQNSPVKLSYWGDNLGVKPGFSIGVEHTFRSIEIERVKKNGKTKFKSRVYFYSLNLATYKHKGYNSALYLYPELGCRKTNRSGFYSELSLGTGIMLTTLDGPTYTVNDLGNINKVNAAGSNYWAFHVSPGLGWDFSKKNQNLPLKIYLKPGLLFQYPYNSLYLKHFIVETGISYSFPNFLPSHTKTIYRKINSNHRN